MTAFLRRAARLEPALVRGLIGLVVAGLLIWGVDLTPLGDQLQRTTDVVGAIIALLSQLWVRQAVTPTDAVVSRVLDPDTPATIAEFVAGGYNVHRPGRVVAPDSTLSQLTARHLPVELYRDVR